MANENGRARTAAARASRTRAKHDRWMAELREAGRLDELALTVLRNYAHLADDGATLDLDGGTVWFGDGGISIGALAIAGTTPATRA